MEKSVPRVRDPAFRTGSRVEKKTSVPEDGSAETTVPLVASVSQFVRPAFHAAPREASPPRLVGHRGGRSQQSEDDSHPRGQFSPVTLARQSTGGLQLFALLDLKYGRNTRMRKIHWPHHRGAITKPCIRAAVLRFLRRAVEDPSLRVAFGAGRPQQIRCASTKITPSEWYQLTMEIAGDEMRVSLDGKAIGYLNRSIQPVTLPASGGSLSSAITRILLSIRRRNCGAGTGWR